MPALIGSILAAKHLRQNIRWIQRHADELGGMWVGGRLVFDEQEIFDYLERKLNGNDD